MRAARHREGQRHAGVDDPLHHRESTQSREGDYTGSRSIDDQAARARKARAAAVDGDARLRSGQGHRLVGRARAGAVGRGQRLRDRRSVVELPASARAVGPPQVRAVGLDGAVLGDRQQRPGVDLERGGSGDGRHAGYVDPRRRSRGDVHAESVVRVVPEEVRVVLCELPSGAREGDRPGCEAPRRGPHEQRDVRAAVEAHHELLGSSGQVADPSRVGLRDDRRPGLHGEVALAGCREPEPERDPLLALQRAYVGEPEDLRHAARAGEHVDRVVQASDGGLGRRDQDPDDPTVRAAGLVDRVLQVELVEGRGPADRREGRRQKDVVPRASGVGVRAARDVQPR